MRFHAMLASLRYPKTIELCIYFVFVFILFHPFVESFEDIDGYDGEDENEYKYAFHYDALDQISMKVDPSEFSNAPEGDYAEIAMKHIGGMMKQRLERMFENTETAGCRALITEHMARFVNSIALEVTVPYSDFEYELENSCPDPIYNFDKLPDDISVDDVMGRTYDATTATYVSHPDQLKILYVILAHDNADRVIRLINKLQIEDGDGHDIVSPSFIVHIDKKEKSNETFMKLSKLYENVENVYILPDNLRVSINWGGFNMVQATLNCLKFIFCIDKAYCSDDGGVIAFDKLVHLASTSYPIKSNSYIRNKISEFPLEANLFDLIMQPNNPAPDTWHYFIECDDRLHRLYRMKSFSRIYTGSQWFIMSYEFAEYIARGLNDSTSFVAKFAEYSKHVVVADEHFFGTVLRNTKYCQTHHNDNFLFLEFGTWDNELRPHERDPSLQKCLFPNPNHCGRSPSTILDEELSILELSPDLFARKFKDEIILDKIDSYLIRRNLTHVQGNIVALNKADILSGYGTLIVDRRTLNSKVPMCIGLGSLGDIAKLVPCFREGIVDTFDDDWFTGAVIEEETMFENRIQWTIGNCSTDGSLTLLDGWLSGYKGEFTMSGPRCQISQRRSSNVSVCLDSDTFYPLVTTCKISWKNLFSFGRHPAKSSPSDVSPKSGSIFSVTPDHFVRDDVIEKNYCFGIGYDDGDGSEILEYVPCSHEQQVLEFAFVPFIVEDQQQNLLWKDEL